MINVANDFVFYYVVLAIFCPASDHLAHHPLAVRAGAQAIRENEPRAISLGYAVDRLLIACAVGGTAGLAGATKAIVTARPLTDVTWQMSGEVVLMTLVSGMGTVFGPIVGAGIIITMQNYLAVSANGCW